MRLANDRFTVLSFVTVNFSSKFALSVSCPVDDKDMRKERTWEGVAIVVTPLCQYAASLALAALPTGVR